MTRLLCPVISSYRYCCVFTSSSVMEEYSSPSGIGPSEGGAEATTPLDNAFPVLHEADADTGGDEEASCGVSLEHMVLPLPLAAPGVDTKPTAQDKRTENTKKPTTIHYINPPHLPCV